MNKLTTTLIALSAMTCAISISSCSNSSQSADRTPETGQLVWPEITRENKPWTRWWWPASAVEKSDIDTMLDQYAQAWLGGMEVTTIYGAKGSEDRFLDYLSPEWMDLFSYTLQEAGKKDLGIDLANASGWPFGGPWVTPDYACRYLATKVYTVHEGESVSDTIKYVEKPMVRSLGLKTDISKLDYPIAANDSLQQYAFEQVRYPLSLPLIAVTANSADGKYIDLTDKVGSDRMLAWTAPEGDWTVCALFLGWHGKQVERAGPGGEGDVIDHFSPTAITRYLAQFDKAFKGYDVSGIRYYFNDSYEVDDAVGNSDWTEDFFQEFRKRRGYDLKPHMPELLGLSEDKQTSDRVVFDYRQTIGELLLENYSMKWQEWAIKQGKGIRNQAHGSPANILDLYAVSDVPETEGRSIVGMKTASSAAHVTDKPLTSSESATWLNEHFRSSLGDVKYSIDTYLLAGVNHVFYHGTCMSPDDAQWPGWLFYAAVHFQPTNSFWTDFAAFNKYVAHCQSFMQAGKPDNDILLFFDATDLLSKRGREPMLYHMSQTTASQSAIGPVANALYEKGYSWDYITDRMISGNISVSSGNIVTKNGTAYKAIIIPQCDKMLVSTFEKLVELANNGATVIFDGSLPADVPGLSDIEKSRARIAKLSSSLKFTGDGAIKTAAVGKGRIMLSTDMDSILNEAGLTREPMYDLQLQCIRRAKSDGGRYYFLRNDAQSEFEGWVPIDVVCGSVGIYNPMTEKMGFGDIRQNADGKTEVFLKLHPAESMLLETFAGKYDSGHYNFYDTAGASKDATTGKWTVTFTKGGPQLPATVTTRKTGSWTAYGKDYEIFSGTAEYSAQLAPVTGTASAWMLNLGDVRNSAAVYLDGEYLGTLFGAPFEIVLSQEQAARGGLLTVAVSNSMENRISWMDRNDIPWRIFYNANIQCHSRDSRGADGYFSADSWPVKDSGLIGPVTVQPLVVAK